MLETLAMRCNNRRRPQKYRTSKSHGSAFYVNEREMPPSLCKIDKVKALHWWRVSRDDSIRSSSARLFSTSAEQSPDLSSQVLADQNKWVAGVANDDTVIAADRSQVV